ncbi:MAG: ribose-5-phosphate isomerase RpiA [Hyphomicrobiales bacterium]|nr:ribose-5-phosphate isomerase RpiA [Hyphomicrobiales bacterium]
MSPKQRAAEAALAWVQPGMRLGLGTGSTAALFVAALGVRVKAGLKVRCVATSRATQAQAEALGIEITTLDDMPELDLTIDGADEIDPALRLVKGGGGALLREKIVAAASRSMLVISDDSKLVNQLGNFPLPVEVNSFGLGATLKRLESVMTGHGVPVSLSLRHSADGGHFVTDGGHLIVDCAFGAIKDAAALSDDLFAIPGVVEHGLFIGLASRALIGHVDTTSEILATVA